MNILLIIAIVIMVLIFLRQVFILKESNKINYAPIILGIGTVFGLLNFIFHADEQNLIFSIQESLVSVILGIVFYGVVVVLQQSKQNEFLHKTGEAYAFLEQSLVEFRDELRDLQGQVASIKELQKNTKTLENEDGFKYDKKALEAIMSNQSAILQKFDFASSWYKEIIKELKDFTKKEFPELDSIVHKHIELLKNQEQDHYVKTKALLLKSFENRVDVKDELAQLKLSIDAIAKSATAISSNIVKYTKDELELVLESFGEELGKIISNASSINTKLYEGESRLVNIKQNSESIMRQMVLSSKKMDEIESQSQNASAVVAKFSELFDEVDKLKVEYIKSQETLRFLTKELDSSNKEHLSSIKNEVDYMVQTLSTRVMDMIYQLEQKEDSSKNQDLLAKAIKARGYLDLGT